MPHLPRYAAFAVWLLLPACSSDDLRALDDAGAATIDAGWSEATAKIDAESPLDAAPNIPPAQLVDGGADAGAPTVMPGFTAVNLRFSAKIGSGPFACARPHASDAHRGFTIEPHDLRFFVERLRFISRSGEEVAVRLFERSPHQTADVALIDFTAGGGACASGATPANAVVTGQVPAGDYVGVAFSTAVPETLNHADPALAPAPLMAPGVHWSWRQGYRFLLANARFVRDPDAGFASDAGSVGDAGFASDAAALDGGATGTGEPSGSHGGGAAPGSVEIHLGSLGCLGGIGVGFNCQTPNRNDIRLMNFDPARSTVVVDLDALFAGVDVASGAVCHGGEAACASARSALGLDPNTGAALTTQSVFRLE